MRNMISKIIKTLGDFVSQTVLRKNVGRNIIIIYVAFILIPVSLLLYVCYHHIAMTTERKIVYIMQDTLDQISTNLSHLMEQTESISNMIFVDPTINTALTTDPELQTIFEQKMECDVILRILNNCLSVDGILNVRLYVKTPKLYRNERINFFLYPEVVTDEFFRTIEQAEGAICWSGVQIVDDSAGNRERVVICGRLLKDFKQFNKPIGAVLVDVSEKAILDILSEESFPEGANICMFDTNGEIKLGENMEISDLDLMSDSICKKGENYFIVSEIESLNWKLVASVPVKELRVLSEWQTSFFGLFAFTMLFVFFLIAFFIMLTYIMRQINNRIRCISDKIKSEGAIHYRKESLDSSSGEFYELELAIDDMIRNIHCLIDRSYSAEIEKKTAEMRMLQAQINPHFLYNTLNSISWMAIQEGAKEVNTVICWLSQYFRLSLSDGRDVVSIREELKLAEAYLNIQNKRFMGMISTEFDVDEDILDESILKLTLQPILENAILHGLQYRKDKKWKLYISAGRNENFIEFHIKDNGIGMSREKLLQLLESIKSEGGHRGGYGLYNVARRLSFCYDNENCIEIHSEPEVGTEVIVRVSTDKKSDN